MTNRFTDSSKKTTASIRRASQPADAASTAPPTNGGALVISLDFELMWGLKDLFPSDGGSYRENVYGARSVIPKLLDLFAEYEISATWATVGMLFAESREELEHFYPERRPAYRDPSFSAYNGHIGENEQDDPLHFAASLVDRIQQYPGQEIGTHTFSHYYCLEEGQTGNDFSADLDAAIAIAASRNIQLRSIVFPRNQHNPEYDKILRRSGVTAYRGNRPFWPDAGVENARYFHPARRMGRLADVYLPIDRQNSTAWESVLGTSGVANVPANRLMIARHPKLERFRLKRVHDEIRAAAQAGRIYHIWWHPHNMGVDQEKHLHDLRSVFEVYRECRELYGMGSLTMAGTVAAARIAHRPRLLRSPGSQESPEPGSLKWRMAP